MKRTFTLSQMGRAMFASAMPWRGKVGCNPIKTKNRCLVTCLTLIAMLMTSLGVKAQTVHIALDNGSLVTGYGPGTDSGWARGFSTMWRHEQLSLTMMASDRDELTASGGIAYPSSVFGEHSAITNDEDDHGITIVGGRRPSFIVVSLPKGYRITGYTMVLSNDLINKDLGGNFNHLNTNQQDNQQNPNGHDYGTMRFYEVNPWEKDHTNSGTTGRSTQYPGYNENQVRYLELGTGWDYENNFSTGGTIGTAASDVLATAKNGNNADIKTSDAIGTEYTISRTANNIGTEEDPIYDMGNQLYFRLVKDYFYYGLTIKSFRLEFTAEGTFEADVVPNAIGPATSVSTAPFNTNKIDIGTMHDETKDNKTIYAFRYENVQDVIAYNYLYQKNAVQDGVPADVDPHKHIRPVKVNVNNKDQLLYALESDTYYLEPPISVTHKGNTAPIGYRIVGALFTPLWGSSSDTEVVPEATYNYIKYTSEGTDYYLNDNGKFVEATEPIAWTSDEDGIHIGDRYLTYSNVNNVRTLTIGRKGDTQKIQLNNNNRLYYQQDETTYYLHGTTDPTVAPSLADNADGLATWAPTTVAAHNAPIFSQGAYKLKIWKRDGSDYMRWKYDNETGLIQSTNDGSSPQYIEISGANDSDLGKVIDIGLCNNDAIKFEIEVEDGKQALVQVTLLLQALDPYIDKMDIVCHDEGDVLQLTQSFTADDFSVSGGKFVFYVPSDYKDEWLTFTFSDLYSKYGDETYYSGGSGAGRYHFVTSPYSFTPDNNGGGTYLGLYDNAYSPDEPYTDKVYTSTAGNIRFKFNNAEDLGENGIQQEGAVLEEYPFSVAIYRASTDPGDPLSTPPHGANPNKNGEFIKVQLKANTTDQHSGTYFVFTADETRWNIAPTTAWEHRFYAFYRMEIDLIARTFTPKFTVERIYDKTFQLYRDPQRDSDGNIKKDDKGNILYNDNGTDVENSMYGLTLDVADTENGQPVQGYLTYQEIIDVAKKGRNAITYDADECNAYNATLTGAIAAGTQLTGQQRGLVNNALHLTGESAYSNQNRIISEEHANAYNATLDGAITTETEKSPAIPAILKTNPAEGPTSLKQFLYVDGTPLYAMLNSSQSSVVKTLGDLKDELADNALVFLPENTTSTLDNVAFKTSDESDNTSYFRAGRNIVLKDKQPFYSPYDIQIDAANYASYTRELTHDGYDPDVNATIMLPFTLYVNQGLHTNEDNTCSFTVNKMQSGTDMQLVKGSSVDYGTAFFVPVTGNWTEANKPYMIHVKSVNPPTTTSGTSGEGSGTEGEGTSGESEDQTTISFIAKQKGALIVATPKTAATTPTAVSEETNQTEPYCTGLLHKGEEASANFGSDTYYFTCYGSFSGSKYDRAVSENVFYFGKNRYVNLHTLWPANKQYMFNYPFRAAYIYTTTAPSPSKEMKWFDISFDEYQGNYGIATGVTDVENVVDLMVRPGTGCMTITTAREQDVNIYTANGIRKERMSLQDGETRIVNMPAGIYIVNNVKVIVK